MEEWEDRPALVLLGPPGSGKTTLFKQEAARRGGFYVTVSDFLTFGCKPEWQDKTLFIDGLDEARAGTADGRTPLDRIRAKLEDLGRPRFRLSCREADWFGARDSDRLETVSPDGTVTVLRLEPLSGEDVRQILPTILGIDDPENFITSAQGKGLHGLLTNPQSLKMLAVAVEPDRDWPDSRMQAFDMACHALLLEHNEEHRIAQLDRGAVSDLMNACGRLCAIQLLTGAAGYTWSGNDSDPDIIELDRVPGENQAILRRCLQSKLFEAPAPRRAVPVHRQIAEFLAAGYLAGLVEDGLPVGRILALMTGYDGVVVSALRGLSAWLAARSKPSRAEAIARDPLWTVLYGDASVFSPTEKCCLLNNLQREADANPSFILTLQLDSRLGDLVSPNMEKHFREFLTDPSRRDSWQSFMVILIEAIRHGERLPGIAGPLMTMLRDDTWWPRIRLRAIEAFLWHRSDADAVAEIKALTADVGAGKVQDPDDFLLGSLLTTLYPDHMSETEIMPYLRLPRRADSCVEYVYFWIGRLPGKSTRDQLAVLLDEAVERYAVLFSKDGAYRLPDSFLCRLPANLLTRFLQLSGDEVELTRLFLWLGLASKAGNRSYDPDFGQVEFQYIREWLEARPDAWKVLLAMGVKGCIDRCDEPYGFAACMHEEEHDRLFAVPRPSDFGLWCLDQAVVAEDANAAGWFLHRSAEALHSGRYSKGLSRKIVSRRLAGHASLQEVFDNKMAEQETIRSDLSVSERHGRTGTETERPNWHDQLKPYEAELRENVASPVLLFELAKVYFGIYRDVRGDTPRERLNAVLADDTGLVEAVLFGFRKTIERDDLPAAGQIIRYGASNPTHHLVYPFMAGLEEVTRTTLSGETDIHERLWRLALAIHFTGPMLSATGCPADRMPGWLGWVLSNRPDVVADVLARSVVSQLRSRAESPAGLHDLASCQDYASVARLVSIPLLKRFPLRCSSGQLTCLNHLLLAARRYGDVDSLLELIDQKCARHGMNVAQQVHWLAAGLCIAPESYVDRLDAYIAAKERRIRFLAEAVVKQFIPTLDLRYRQSVPAFQLLIRLLGASYRPYSFDFDSDDDPNVGVIVTSEMKVAFFTGSLIEQLAANATEEASHALEALSSDDDLRPWRSRLIDFSYRQRARRREAQFVHANVSQVVATLNSGVPANVADLAAMTVEHLRQIARNIRDGNTSDWRQYWNVDGYNHPLNPRPEAACRDALLSDLRNRLQQLGIDVEPEARYADDKRADIRVSSGQHQVPIEVKRSCESNLWSAIQSQLIARYVRDPGTGGHGIYLVFWFGDTDGCRPTPPVAGLPPGNSQELEQRLISTLSAEEQFRIRICTVDVAAPCSGAAERTGSP